MSLNGHIKTNLHLILKICLFILSVSGCFYQTKPTSGLQQIETSRFRINTVGAAYAEIEIFKDAIWKVYEIIDEPIGTFEFSVQERELNKKGTKELILFWTNRQYGSGGGSEMRGIQIWDLDRVATIFDEVNFCSTESFGDESRNGFVNVCKKKIEIKNQYIVVGNQSCEYSGSSDFDPLVNCKLTKLTRVFMRLLIIT